MSNLKNVDIGKETGRLHFIGGAYINGYLWTNASEWNGCYKVDIETGRAEFLGLFEYADIFADKLFYQVLAYEKYVFYIPWFSDYLVRLDTETLDTKYWKLPDSIVSEVAKFRAAYVYNGKIFMFPHCGDEICIFNIEKEEFQCDKAWLETFLKHSKENEKDKFVQGVQSDSVAWLANLAGSFLMKCYLDTYEYEVVLFPESEKKILDIIVYRDNELFILTWMGNVWKYNVDLEKKELIYRYDGKIENPYRHIFSIENELYLIPANEKNIKVLREGKDKIISYPYDWKLQYKNVGLDCIFNGYLKQKDKVIIYPCKGNLLLKMDVQQKTLSGTAIREKIQDREKAIGCQLYKTRQLLYEPRADLSLILNVLTNRKSENTDTVRIDGRQIWDRMRGIN